MLSRPCRRLCPFEHLHGSWSTKYLDGRIGRPLGAPAMTVLPSQESVNSQTTVLRGSADKSRPSGGADVQRWVVQAVRISLRPMMMALAQAMNALITRVCFSVQMANFLKPRLCQELERSMTQRAPACSGVPLVLFTAVQPSWASSPRVALESCPASRCTQMALDNWNQNRPSVSSVGRRNTESWRLAPAITQPTGMPVLSTSRERLVPRLLRSTGDRPAVLPPRRP